MRLGSLQVPPFAARTVASQPRWPVSLSPGGRGALSCWTQWRSHGERQRRPLARSGRSCPRAGTVALFVRPVRPRHASRRSSRSASRCCCGDRWSRSTRFAGRPGGRPGTGTCRAVRTAASRLRPGELQIIMTRGPAGADGEGTDPRGRGEGPTWGDAADQVAIAIRGTPICGRRDDHAVGPVRSTRSGGYPLRVSPTSRATAGGPVFEPTPPTVRACWVSGARRGGAPDAGCADRGQGTLGRPAVGGALPPASVAALGVAGPPTFPRRSLARAPTRPPRRRGRAGAAAGAVPRPVRRGRSLGAETPDADAPPSRVRLSPRPGRRPTRRPRPSRPPPRRPAAPVPRPPSPRPRQPTLATRRYRCRPAIGLPRPRIASPSPAVRSAGAPRRARARRPYRPQPRPEAPADSPPTPTRGSSGAAGRAAGAAAAGATAGGGRAGGAAAPRPPVGARPRPRARLRPGGRLAAGPAEAAGTAGRPSGGHARRRHRGTEPDPDYVTEPPPASPPAAAAATSSRRGGAPPPPAPQTTPHARVTSRRPTSGFGSGGATVVPPAFSWRPRPRLARRPARDRHPLADDDEKRKRKKKPARSGRARCTPGTDGSASREAVTPRDLPMWRGRVSGVTRARPGDSGVIHGSALLSW